MAGGWGDGNGGGSNGGRGWERATPTAAVLIIGDEILSGRTLDTNIGTIARFLTPRGIDLREVRVVADDEPAIIAAR